MTLAVIWHWWIAPTLTAAAIGLIVATVMGYINKVVKPRYQPKK
ncbi:MAG: hypothetical protein ACKVKO_02625 [Acidimicrobiales bacterium]|jgi:hypothetical protein